MRNPSHKPLLLAVIAFWMELLLETNPLHAAKPTPSPKIPPQPVPVSLSSPKGDPAEIPLRIYGIRPLEIEFRIHSQPASGMLSDIRPEPGGGASVTYTPLPGSETNEDRFFYAVKTRDGVSAPAEVRLSFVAKMPRIVAPASVLFPDTALGESSQAELPIRNIGEARGEGRVEIPTPWKLEGDGRFNLEPGSSQTFHISFHPTDLGPQVAAVPLPGSPPRNVALSGKAVPVLELSPAELTLSSDPGSSERCATFVLSNHSSRALPVQIEADPRLQIEPVGLLPPNSRTTRSVMLPESDVAALDCRLSFRGHPATIHLTAPARPARLEFLNPSLDYGTLLPGTRRTLKFQLRNSGGLPAQIQIRVETPFYLAAIPPAEIPPGGTLELPVVAAAGPPGKTAAILEAKTPLQTVSIPISATVLPPLEPSKSPPPPASARSQTSPIPNQPLEEKAPRIQPPFRPLDGPVEFHGKTARLHWKGDRSRPLLHRAELRKLIAKDDGELEMVWVPIPEFAPEVAGEHLRGSVSGLPDGRMVWIRIVPVDELGVAAGIPWLATFRVPAAKPVGAGGVLLCLGVTAAVTGLVWMAARRLRTGRL